jgi:hypothetical protein
MDRVERKILIGNMHLCNGKGKYEVIRVRKYEWRI